LVRLRERRLDRTVKVLPTDATVFGGSVSARHKHHFHVRLATMWASHS